MHTDFNMGLTWTTEITRVNINFFFYGNLNRTRYADLLVEQVNENWLILCYFRDHL